MASSSSLGGDERGVWNKSSEEIWISNTSRLSVNYGYKNIQLHAYMYTNRVYEIS